MSAVWMLMAAMGLAAAGQEPLFRLVGLYDEMSSDFYGSRLHR